MTKQDIQVKNSDDHCTNGWFDCGDNRKCISSMWQCDGDNDCDNGADEINCLNRPSIPVTCSPGHFYCPGSNACLPEKWLCDGHKDCAGGVDENNCTTQATTESTIESTTESTIESTTESSCTEFKCSNNKCIPSQSVCNDINDCGDDSDEKDCVFNGVSSALTSPRTFFLIPVLMVALIKLIN